jgi:glycosyltransferase involved in cell wall biosynthesis
VAQKLKIAYIVVGENLAVPLLRRQVVELLGDVKRNMGDGDITLFLFLGIATVLRLRADLQATRLRLRELGIPLVVIPTICPWPIPNFRFMKTNRWQPKGAWNRWAVIFFKVLSFPVLAFLRLVGGYKIFHCRSYPATAAAIFLKQFITSTSVLFDPRSDFPEESVSAGSWGSESRDFKYWKKEEKRLLQASDVVACIAPSYVRHYQQSTESFNYFIAPNNVRCSEFKREPSVRNKIRRFLDFGDSDAVFTYLGDMTERAWHRPSFYRSFYDSLIQLTNAFRFLFLVPECSASFVKNVFRNDNRVVVVSPSFREIPEYLAAADYGMMFLHRAKIAVGTKISEYLAASLPIIVNENCIGAVELLERYPGLGCKVNLGLGELDSCQQCDENTIAHLRELLYAGDSLHEYAINHYDNSVIAKRYVEQYRRMALPRHVVRSFYY